MDQDKATEEDILLQLEGLAFDSLQVVSYKWLSRHFLISSNAAKRLLQKFAEQNRKTELEIVYGVSGWSSQDPHTYSMELVPKSRLEEATAAVQGEPSVHVYSVQRSLSKDPAQLWSTEFTQAEFLFNEPSEVVNCFRDNRFSAVSCNLAQRSSKKRPRAPTSAQPSNGATTSATPALSVPKAQPQTPAAKTQESKLNDASAGKKQQPVPPSAKTPSSETEAFSGSASAGKKRPISVTAGSSAGSSLASMWGKAPPAKSKPSADPVSSGRTAAVKSSKTAGDAEARIQAMEAEDNSEDEDMASEFAGLRRGQQNSSRGRRRMIIENADDDLDEDDEAQDPERIVRLRSPESSPPLPPPPKINGRTIASTEDTHASEHHDDASSAPKVLSSNGKIPSSLQSTTSAKRHGGPEQESNLNGKGAAEGSGPTSSVSEAPRDSSKRKKVYKTTLDSQGKEVSVCVWETEEGGGATEDSTKPPTSSRETNAKAPTVKPQLPQKPPATSKSSTSKAGAKASAKSGGKPAKGQGSITSFFKKT